jgi:hypothetical protein
MTAIGCAPTARMGHADWRRTAACYADVFFSATLHRNRRYGLAPIAIDILTSLLAGQTVNKFSWLLSGATAESSGITESADWTGILSNAAIEMTCSKVRHRYPYLCLHRVADELPDTEMLLDPLEEQLHLPATLVKGAIVKAGGVA